MTRIPSDPIAIPADHLDGHDPRREDGNLAEHLDIVSALSPPPRSDAAFVAAVRSEVSIRREKLIRRSRFGVWLPSLASAAALTWWVVPLTNIPPSAAPISQAVTQMTAKIHVDNLLQESMDVIDEEDLWLDNLDDESLLALHDSLER